jgi:hypothetical protein
MVYCPNARASSTNRPTTKASKSISALPPQLGTMLIWPVISSVTRPLLSHGLVVRQHPQNTLVRSLVHASRLDRHSAARSPFEPSTQLLDTTRRAVPPVSHSGLIGDASAFAATEKENAIVCVPSIQNARFAVAFRTCEQEVSSAEICFPPMATNDLPHRIQHFAAGGLARKLQHQLPRIRATGYFKPNSSEQPTLGAKFQFPFAGQLMNVKPSALHVAKLAL